MFKPSTFAPRAYKKYWQAVDSAKAYRQVVGFPLYVVWNESWYKWVVCAHCPINWRINAVKIVEI